MGDWIALCVLVAFGLIVLAAVRVAHGILNPQPPPLYDYKPNPTMMCDACGSGPWHKEWDRDSENRTSRKWYCPNCTGAD